MSAVRYFRRWGFALGRLNICWLDMWTGARGLEVSWGQRLLFGFGFKNEARS